MPRVDKSTINWAVYEDNTEYAGMAQATLPNLTALTKSISGAGIAGNVDAVILGHFDAMSMTLNYRTMTEQSVRRSEPRRHNIDLRYAVQDEDPVAAAVQVRAIKHNLVVFFLLHTPVFAAPATPENGTGEFAGRYWATYIDAKKVRENEPLNIISLIDGTDYLADVRKALGK